MALKVGELFASFNLDTSGVSSAVKSAEKQLSDIGKGLAIGGAAMTAAVTVPLKAAAQQIYSAGSEFDAEMSKVFAIAGDSVTSNAKAMEDLRKKALEMGSTTQFTATQAGEAMEYMAMAGWKSEEMLKAIEPLMNLAAAAGADLGTTSDIVTDAMTAFGLSATDMVDVVKDGMKMSVNAVDYFADILAAASSNSNTNVTMLGESFKFAAPLAGSFGYSLNDVAIALGLMANNGIKSSMAGTSLSRVIQNMVKPSDETALAMKALGVSLYDSQGNAKSWREVMMDFRSAAKKGGVDTSKLSKEIADLDTKFQAGKLSEEEYEAELEKLGLGAGGFMRQVTQIAGARGLPGLLAIMNATDEDFDKLAYSIDNATGSAEKMAATMLDNAKGDVTKLKSAIEGLEITLWGLAEGGFRNVIQNATGLVDAFRQTSKETQLGTLRIAALAAAAGPAMVAMGSLISVLPKLAHTFTAVTSPAALLAVGMIALGAAAIDSGNTMGKTFVKAASSAGKKVKELGKNVKAQLPQLTKNMNAFLNSLIEGIGKSVPNLMDGLGDVLATGLSALASGMRNAGNVAKTLITTIAGGIQRNLPEIVPAALDLMKELAAAIIRNIPVVLRGMGTVITSLVEAVRDADWGDIGSGLGSALRTSMSEIDVWFRRLAMGEKYKEGATWADVGKALMENLLDGMKKRFGNARDFIGNLLLGNEYKPDEDWKDFGSKLIDKIFQGADSAIGGATDFVSGILTSIGNLFTDDAMEKASGSLSSIAGTLIDHIFAEVPKLADRAGTLLEKIATLILGDENSNGLASNALSGAKTLVEAIFTSLSNTMDSGNGTGAAQKLLGVLGKAFSQENISRITNNLQDLVKAIFDGMKTVLPKLSDQAGSVISSMIDLMFEKGENGTSLSGAALTSVQTLVSTLIRSIIDFLPHAITIGENTVSAGFQIATALLDSLAGAFDTTLSTDGVDVIGEKLGSFARKIITGMTTLLPKLFEVGGKAVSAGVKLATELVTSLVEGFTGTNFSTDFAGMAQSIIGGITGAVSNLPALLGDVLSAGAQIAGSIMTSITDAITATAESGAAVDLGQMGVQFIHQMLSSVANLGENADVKTFMTELGKGFNASMGMLGDFAAQIVTYIVSGDAFVDLFNAGATVGQWILSGIKGVFEGLGNFFEHLVGEALVGFGIVDRDELEANRAARQVVLDYQSEFQQAYLHAVDGIKPDDDLTNALFLALMGGKQNNFNYGTIFRGLDATKLETFLQQYESLFEGGDYSLIDQWATSFWLGFTGEKTDENIQKWIRSFMSAVGITDLPDELMATMTEAFKLGSKGADKNAFYEMLLSYLLGEDTSMESEVEAAVDEAVASAETAMKAAANDMQDATQDIVNSVEQGSNALAKNGMATAVKEGAGPVEAAALEVSDSAVKTFLLKMSAENGGAIGTEFVEAIKNALTDADLAETARTIADSSLNTVRSILNSSSGFNTGENFGIGLANGINSTFSAVTTAAYNLGKGAADSLSSAIQEGSPSKLTAKSGENFGLGFINTILAGVTDAENAAAMLGAGAVSSLNSTVRQMQDEASNGLSVPMENNRSAAASRSAENERTAQQFADAVAKAINGMKVEMDGEQVGVLVTPTVSERIAETSMMRRYGTE